MKAAQRAGRFLSNVVFQNIAALLAFGMFRILFDHNGWWPQPELFHMANTIFTYVIPLLFAYTGGRNIGGQRGGVIAAFVLVGFISSNSQNYSMILPALAIGPAVGYLIKKVDKWMESRIPIGFELLFFNTVAGLIGITLSVLGSIYVSPLFIKMMQTLFHGVEHLVESKLLPLVALVIEPGKVLFFNNAINHGVLEPIGIHQAKEMGRSILFLLETNPGPGLGLLLAYLLFYKGKERANIKSSLTIQLLGGIHEVYFPYALLNPLTILPLILGGMTGNVIFSIFQAGLLSTPSPGSIIMLMVMSPKGVHLHVLIGVLASAAVSFLGTSFVLYWKKSNIEHVEVKGSLNALAPIGKRDNVEKIVFACDAGMGSSAMAAAMLRKKLRQAKLNIEVSNVSVDDIPEDGELVIIQEKLAQRAKEIAPKARYIQIISLVDPYFYDELTDWLQSISSSETMNELQEVEPNIQVVTADHIMLGLRADNKWDVIRQAGELLVKLGHVEPPYIDEMIQRERIFSTYIGNGVAIPHGTHTDSPLIRNTGIVILQYPEGVDFGNNNKAKLVIAIAGQNQEHLSILSALASLIESGEDLQKMIETKNKEDIQRIVREAILA